jgi:site-specific recombinase XerD
MRLEDITRDSLRTAFSIFAESHAGTSIRRCWSTWNTVRTWLYSSELIPGNPMTMVGRAMVKKHLSKALLPSVIDAILADLAHAEKQPPHRDDWVHRIGPTVYSYVQPPRGSDHRVRGLVTV